MSVQGSLAGIRVVEIGTSVAVPFGCQILGDFGAEVIKVERLGTGDEARMWAPLTEGVSVTFLSLNRNKKSVVLNYKADEGKQALEELLQTADVLVQNLRPGALAAAGFSWENLRETNPRLIYVEMTGYGHAGPRREQPAYDAMLQAYSGVVAMTGSDEGEPARVPLSMMDMGTGLWLSLGVFDALRRREQTGEGAHVQVSLLQTALAWVGTPLMGVAAGGPVPQRLGSGFRGNVPNGAFPASDGYVFLSVGSNDAFYRLLDAIEAPHLRDDPAFENNVARVSNRQYVNAQLGAATAKFTMQELLERLDAAQVPHSAVNTLDRVLEDEQVKALGQLQPIPHATLGDVTIVNSPLTIDGEYLAHQNGPPLLGADTVDVLASVGIDEGRIDRLLADGVIETHTEGARA
ncbi:CaiB/BaiF CoA transferase family protein [Microbacterium gallinarum]|uniref:CoA transferase n=1 Tax=Microbacterium gallinarum TaxID=2762209 RepID=A0ABR8X1G7_9MICO|nr:CoA transferase [Microbacterium gallinarum]MBD8022736.1 CoA transferase [Microbacterium gallinarum]